MATTESTVSVSIPHVENRDEPAMETPRQLTHRAHAELRARAALLTGTQHTDRAIALLEDGKVFRVDGQENVWLVAGWKSDPRYEIKRNTCRCQTEVIPGDAYKCAHLLAIYLYKLVETEMQKAGQPMFVHDASEPGLPLGPTPPDEHLATMPQETSKDSQQDTLDAVNWTPPVVDEQRHEIRKLLVEFGAIVIEPGKKVTREEYDQACETHVGLSLVPEQFGAIITRLEEMIAARRAALPSPKLLKDYMVKIRNKEYIQYGGLLAYAHERGLVSLQAELVTVTPELALATAKAAFQDGRTFVEGGDATPENVNKNVRAHYARVALTRAKARVLRDALNIAAVALEELGSEADNE